MYDILIKRVSNLLTVKSIVTIVLTIVFAILTCLGKLDQGFMTVYTVIVSFYFGIQSVKSGGGDE